MQSLPALPKEVRAAHEYPGKLRVPGAPDSVVTLDSRGGREPGHGFFVGDAEDADDLGA